MCHYFIDLSCHAQVLYPAKTDRLLFLIRSHVPLCYSNEGYLAPHDPCSDVPVCDDCETIDKGLETIRNNYETVFQTICHVSNDKLNLNFKSVILKFSLYLFSNSFHC